MCSHYPVRNGDLKEKLLSLHLADNGLKGIRLPPGISCWEEEVAEISASYRGNSLLDHFAGETMVACKASP